MRDKEATRQAFSLDMLQIDSPTSQEKTEKKAVKTPSKTPPELCFMERFGKTTFIVSVKPSEQAKKPINSLFRDVCIREVLNAFQAS